MKSQRVIAGALVAPLMIPALYFFGEAVLSGYTRQGPGHVDKLLWTTVGLIAPLAYLGSFIGGTPLVWLLHKMDRLRLGNCVWGAGAIGMMEGFIILLVLHRPDNSPVSPGELALTIPSVLLAMLVAAVFCMVAGVPVREQPELQLLSLPTRRRPAGRLDRQQ
jgi:hypothetical protein